MWNDVMTLIKQRNAIFQGDYAEWQIMQNESNGIVQ